MRKRNVDRFTVIKKGKGQTPMKSGVNDKTKQNKTKQKKPKLQFMT